VTLTLELGIAARLNRGVATAFKPRCRVQFFLMLSKTTFLHLIAGLAMLAPFQVQATSRSNFVDIGGPYQSFNTTKWEPNVNSENRSLASTFYGEASWYGPGFYGRTTACGQVYRPGTFTVAHKNLPCDTPVRITNLNNGRVGYAIVNDRGPYVNGRIVDLGHGIARQLGLTSTGVADVKLEVLR
jgi:rare lipoprotein A (peptidoglycan hydrolase)